MGKGFILIGGDGKCSSSFSSIQFWTDSVIFYVSTHRVIVGLFRFNLNVSSEWRSIMRIVAAVDSTAGSAQCGVRVTINVFTSRLALLEVCRRRVFGVILEHLDRHSTVNLVLKMNWLQIVSLVCVTMPYVSETHDENFEVRVFLQTRLDSSLVGQLCCRALRRRWAGSSGGMVSTLVLVHLKALECIAFRYAELKLTDGIWYNLR